MSTTSLSQDQRCNARQRSEEKKGREINSLNRFSGAIGSIYRGHFIIFLPRTGRHRYLHARGIQIHSAVSRIRFLGLSGAGRASKRNRVRADGELKLTGCFQLWHRCPIIRHYWPRIIASRVMVTRCYRISLKLQRSGYSIIPVSNPDLFDDIELQARFAGVLRNKFERRVCYANKIIIVH